MSFAEITEKQALKILAVLVAIAAAAYSLLFISFNHENARLAQTVTTIIQDKRQLKKVTSDAATYKAVSARRQPDIEIDSENLSENGASYYIININGRDYEVSFNAEKLTKLSPRS